MVEIKGMFKTFLIMFHDGTWVYNGNTRIDFDNWEYTDDKGNVSDIIETKEIYLDIKPENKLYCFYWLKCYDGKEFEFLIKVREKWRL